MNTKPLETVAVFELIQNYCVNEPTTKATLGDVRKALSALPSASEESLNDYCIQIGDRYYRQRDVDGILYPVVEAA